MNEQPILDNEVTKVDPVSPGNNLPDISGILLRRKSYLVLGAVIGIVLGVLFYAIAPRKYESTAQILVLKKQMENPIQNAENMHLGGTPSVMTQDFLETHRSVLRSPMVVSRAVEKENLQELEMFRGEDKLVDTIIKSLKVDREMDKKSAGRINAASQVLNVSFQGKIPEECSVVVDAILKSYEDFLNDSSRGPLKETMALINKARILIQEDMTKKEDAYAEFRAKTPVLWKGPMGTTLYQERLANIDAQRSSLMRQEVEMKATMAAVEAVMKENKNPAAALQILAGVSTNREMPVGFATMNPRTREEVISASSAMPMNQHLTLEDELLRLELEETKALEIMGPEHPEVISLSDRIKSLQALLAPANHNSSKPNPLSEKDHRNLQRLVETKLGQLKQQLRENQRSQKALADLFEIELTEAKKVFPYETQDDTFKRSLDRSWFLYENILKRMEDLDILSNVGGYDAQVIAPPDPGEKVFPKAILVFPVALFFGLLVGFGLGYVAEMTDKDFHTPDEIRGRLGLPIIGHVPVLKTDNALLQKIEAEGSTLHPMICTHHRPRSRDAESYRGIRTALYFSTRGRGYKTIQVTSPNMGDGKSTLAANLAVSVAQTGKKVVLIDADLRRPQQHELFGLTNTAGFSSVLEGTAEIPEVVQESTVPGLSIIPSGPAPANPAELLTSHRFKELLDVISQQCDLVIVDTPPLLAVSDPSVIAPRVDGVVLAIRLGKKSRPHAEQAKEILFTLGAHVLGVVVNAIPDSKSRYGGYGYGYGYGEYGYGKNNRYYHEEHQEASNGKS